MRLYFQSKPRCPRCGNSESFVRVQPSSKLSEWEACSYSCEACGEPCTWEFTVMSEQKSWAVPAIKPADGDDYSALLSAFCDEVGLARRVG